MMHFTHGGDDVTLISSADWMPRNLDRRIELLVPVESADCKKVVIDSLQTFLTENVKGHELQSDGSYQRIAAPEKGQQTRSQQFFYRQAVKAAQQSKQSTPTTFEPHKA